MTARGGANALARRNDFGVYVHIPFCAARCDYCAFAIWTDRGELVERYVDAVITEIALARSSGSLSRAATVYFGGGTPSLIGAGQLVRILSAVELEADAEVTVECNPESTTPELLEALHKASVTRISLGVQSLSPPVLVSLGRTHTARSAMSALELVATCGFRTFSLDLIYGAAGETDDSWRRTLERVLDSARCPPHISAYGLSVEPGTALAKDPRRHPDDDTEARRYLIADELLSARGYRWYELSNWALPGHECRHNWASWAQGEYLGFGCAAHSHVNRRRLANVFSIDRYLERIESGRSAVARETRLQPADRELERLELALRTRAGVPMEALDPDVLALGLVAREGNRAVLTQRGRLLANEVTMRLHVPSGVESLSISHKP